MIMKTVIVFFISVLLYGLLSISEAVPRSAENLRTYDSLLEELNDYDPIYKRQSYLTGGIRYKKQVPGKRYLTGGIRY
uniref:1020HH-2 n=1 Tax=Schmidtea mediterranea TaxID=79327 RepID=E3CTK0_SCHMD|nr:1020HH-2 [Schmidtea mediterranea]DAA33914.1 TPA_inf: 1020HH-2 [Schmidtea mediterranea]